MGDNKLIVLVAGLCLGDWDEVFGSKWWLKIPKALDERDGSNGSGG